jgi:uncharacterized protein
MEAKRMPGILLVHDAVLVPRVTRAVSTLARMRGLLGRKGLPAGEGLLIERCGSIHTVGMRFAIDAIFLDRAWRVCRVARGIRPGRLCIWGGWRAQRCLEVAAGRLDTAPLAPGTPLTWRE